MLVEVFTCAPSISAHRTGAHHKEYRLTDPTRHRWGFRRAGLARL